jgi:hypothetical protein
LEPIVKLRGDHGLLQLNENALGYEALSDATDPMLVSKTSPFSKVPT